MEAFHRLIAAGKVRAIGASNLSLWRIAETNMLAELRGWNQYCAIEQRYTYLRPRHGTNFGPQIFMHELTRDFAQAHGIALIGYSVLLAGAYLGSKEALAAQFAGPDSDE